MVLASLYQHYNRRKCTGQKIIESKAEYNFHKNLYISDIIGPLNFLEFYKSIDLDPYIKANCSHYSCNIKDCRFKASKEDLKWFKRHAMEVHLNVEVKCYACDISWRNTDSFINHMKHNHIHLESTAVGFNVEFTDWGDLYDHVENFQK